MYPKPTKSNASRGHAYCKDAACSKVVGIKPLKTLKVLKKTKEIRFKSNAPQLPKETLSRDNMRTLFGGNALQFVSKGSFGSVYKFVATAKYIQYLKTLILPKTKTLVGKIDKIPVGRMSIIKFQTINYDPDEDGPDEAANVHEMKVHAKLSKSNISSKFYAGGIIENWSWQISSFVDGPNLCNVDITEDIFKNIETVIFKLWKNGIYHGDAHCGNFILSKNNVFVIDFGRAIILPQRYIPKTLTEFRDSKYQDRVQRYADTVVTKRAMLNSGYVWDRKPTAQNPKKHIVAYADNVQALRVFYDRIEKNKL